MDTQYTYADHEEWANRIPLAIAIICRDHMEATISTLTPEMREQVQPALDAVRARIAKEAK